jgi:hypothetical protein
MLDALVAEAREHWRLDLSAGIQVVATERLISTPIEASRPLLLVPLDQLGGAESGGNAAPAATTALPGRHGPEGRDPVRLLARLYRRTRWSLASPAAARPRSAH